MSEKNELLNEIKLTLEKTVVKIIEELEGKKCCGHCGNHKEDVIESICNVCNGDGYMKCIHCIDGYNIKKTELGKTNIVTPCEICEGTGEVICPVCKGTAKISYKKSDIPGKFILNEESVKKYTAEEIEEAILVVFNTLEHDTVVRPLRLRISDMEYVAEGKIVIHIPNHLGTLVKDEKFEKELAKLSNKFGLIGIEIHNRYFAEGQE